MARLRRTLDEVVIAVVVGMFFIALACVEGLRAPEAGLTTATTVLQLAPGDPVVLLNDRTASPVR